jgi:hypothetical protein
LGDEECGTQAEVYATRAARRKSIRWWRCITSEGIANCRLPIANWSQQERLSEDRPLGFGNGQRCELAIGNRQLEML